MFQDIPQGPGLLGAFPFGDIAANGLEFQDTALRIADGVIEPLLPADVSVRQEDLMLVGDHAWVLGEGCDMAESRLTSRGGDELKELLAEQFLACFAEQPAVGIVDKCQTCVRAITADQLGLALDDAPIARFAGT